MIDMKIDEAKRQLTSLNKDEKYQTMIYTAAIITKLLDKEKIKPIIVGGLSVNIYTQNDYTTRDIDFVSDGYNIIKELLLTLDFEKENRFFYRDDIEIAIEIPDNHLEGDMSKVQKLELENGLFIYVISLEDIIIDRLSASLYWNSEDDGIWGFQLLTKNFETLDITYIKNTLKAKQEKAEFKLWLQQIEKFN